MGKARLHLKYHFRKVGMNGLLCVHSFDRSVPTLIDLLIFPVLLFQKRQTEWINAEGQPHPLPQEVSPHGQFFQLKKTANFIYRVNHFDLSCKGCSQLSDSFPLLHSKWLTGKMFSIPPCRNNQKGRGRSGLHFYNTLLMCSKLTIIKTCVCHSRQATHCKKSEALQGFLAKYIDQTLDISIFKSTGSFKAIADETVLLH